MITDEKRIDAVLSRGVAEVIGAEELKKRMLAGEKLRIKLGIDPTSKNVHIGRSIPLLKLRDFQELGHQIVLIIGDATGVIGDTSDKTAERPMLEQATIDENKEAYYDQIAKILDMDKVEFCHNGDWLNKLSFREIGEIADIFSVAEFIARENIRLRLDAGKRVSLREMMYPLMQGYDSVAVRSDVEIGGSDQRFNNLAGRTIQPHFGQKPQSIVLGPIINGVDGQKMSSSKGNVIALTMEPNEMFGKVMSMRDDDIITYLTVCTRIPLEEIAEMSHQLSQGMNPRDIKMRLAHELVRMYYTQGAADAAQQAFIDTFQKGGIPDDVEEISTPYIDTLLEKEIIKSKTELRTLLAAGAVSNIETGEKYEIFPEKITKPTVLKIGKRRFVKLI
ncbi:tyrosine--tRNA ligase [Candidatus Kaiserbacteria bacterium RIFCSPHIGHO2_02_FULL_49_34]|uniref:Tyrosine--tRNA ligase n=1 Tax=Candidatus Kaiserbacteria bacterium RIFCSPHIGHO2_02_FULL_49_34 TaxID=1798491 RepID=A0A1F6DJF2_9BACT|nr:MAG: tyrosine--tRNA ligase [Candidatus Kaiserbacteria bacterium RIFCSPHIGHO2_02_FULL_49_34]